MTAAYEELRHVLDERDINYSTGEDQSIRTTIRGDVSTYWTAARVEDDLFQVASYSPVRIPPGSLRDIAEAIRDMIRQLLAVFQIPNEELKFYLREDRDAGRGEQRDRFNHIGAS